MVARIANELAEVIARLQRMCEANDIQPPTSIEFSRKDWERIEASLGYLDLIHTKDSSREEKRLGTIAILGVQVIAAHEWHDFKGMPCCKICGVVRRRDGQNRGCSGPVAVTLRGGDK